MQIIVVGDGCSYQGIPKDDQFWPVDGVGTVVRNEDVDSEPKVHVLLSALKRDYKDPLNHLSRTG